VRRNPASDYDAELAVAVDMSLFLAQSGKMIFLPSVMRSLPHALPHAHVRRNPASDYDAELTVAVDMSLSLAQSGQMISSPSVMKPLPAMESWHIAHIKHCECQWRPSNEIKRVPPAPVMGLLQAVHRLANSSPKQIAQ